MVEITFDVRTQDGIYLLRFSEMLEMARERGELGEGRGYLNPTIREKVEKIKNIIDNKEGC